MKKKCEKDSDAENHPFWQSNELKTTTSRGKSATNIELIILAFTL